MLTASLKEGSCHLGWGKYVEMQRCALVPVVSVAPKIFGASTRRLEPEMSLAERNSPVCRAANAGQQKQENRHLDQVWRCDLDRASSIDKLSGQNHLSIRFGNIETFEDAHPDQRRRFFANGYLDIVQHNIADPDTGDHLVKSRDVAVCSYGTGHFASFSSNSHRVCGRLRQR